MNKEQDIMLLSEMIRNFVMKNTDDTGIALAALALTFCSGMKYLIEDKPRERSHELIDDFFDAHEKIEEEIGPISSSVEQ